MRESTCSCGSNDFRWATNACTHMICERCEKVYRALPVRDFNHQDDLFLRAVELGCTPLYTGASWECRCPGAVHAVSTTCAILTIPSLERAKANL